VKPKSEHPFIGGADIAFLPFPVSRLTIYVVGNFDLGGGLVVAMDDATAVQAPMLFGFLRRHRPECY